MTRAPGPHPLPVFLAVLQSACAGDSARLAAALAGLARYQQAPRPAPVPLRAEVARVGGVALRGRLGQQGRHGRRGPHPLVIVPSLINSPEVLDLPGRSLFAALETAGVDPLLVDWGLQPEPLGLADLVRDRLAPLVQSLGQPVALMGYCLGGTLALALAAQVNATRIGLIATPWNFAGYDGEARAGLTRWWASAEPLAQTMGQLPIDLLQPAFWSLDPDGLAAKYERLATADAATLADFVRLEDWANGGAPLSLAVARDLAALFGGDAPTLGPLLCPVPAIPILDAVALSDRIVPAAAALSPPGSAARLDIAGGHVGMVVGRQAPARLWAALTQFFAAE